MTYFFEKAYIIGNGPSRKDYDLNNLYDQCTFGCNAVYRDYECSWLVAIDDKIIQEIKQSSYPQKQCIFPPEEERWEPADFIPDRRARSNTGMNACIEAIRKGYTELYLLGFDFMISNRHYAEGNLYDGTNGYEPETRAAYGDTLNRVKYFEWFANKNPEINFYICLPDHDFMSNNDVHPLNAKNVRGIYYNQLLT